MLPLPKTANLDHIHNNADVEFEISEANIDVLKRAKQIRNYGEASLFPVYGGKMKPDGTSKHGIFKEIGVTRKKIGMLLANRCTRSILYPRNISLLICYHRNIWITGINHNE
jgi:hypothetical protein